MDRKEFEKKWEDMSDVYSDHTVGIILADGTELQADKYKFDKKWNYIVFYLNHKWTVSTDLAKIKEVF